jgi:hypothetical protein
MFYATFADQGLPSGFYNSQIHKTIPSAAVPLTDGQYQEFIQNQGLRIWRNGQVQAYTPPVDLKAYAANRRWETEVGGFSLAGIRYASDDRAKTLILGVKLMCEQDPAHTENWYAADGSVHPMDKTAIDALATAMASHVSSCFRVYGEVMAGITAGSITTTSEIDAAFGAVSAA